MGADRLPVRAREGREPPRRAGGGRQVHRGVRSRDHGRARGGPALASAGGSRHPRVHRPAAAARRYGGHARGTVLGRRWLLMFDLTPATDQLAVLVRNVSDSDLKAPTPCPDYTVGDLLDHVNGLSVAFTMAARKTPMAGTGAGDAAR